MFDLVSDVHCYPQFLLRCDATQIAPTHSDGQTAEISMNSKGLRQKFSTRNRHIHHESGALEDRLSLVQGPFSRLEGRWLFVPVGAVLDWIASSSVDAFVKRMKNVHG